MTQRNRYIAFGLLLALGVVLWLTMAGHAVGPPLLVAILPVAWLLCLVPAVNRPLARALDALRTPSPRAALRVALGVGVVAFLYLLHVAFFTHRSHVPQWHDEYMNLLQMRMLAGGRLWMPEHPLADFFETLFIQVRGAYASIYFPGTSLLYTPTIWLNLHHWVGPLLVSSAVVAMTYRIATEIIDGLAGLLAAFLLLGLEQFRMASIMLISHPVMALMGLLMLWGWLNWRKSLHTGWAVLIGIAAGWAAITRPLDAVCFGLPVAIAMLLRLRGEPAKKWALTILPGIAATLPFLSLQVILNTGTTGEPLTTPYVRYLEAYQPNSKPGFPTFDPAARPKSTLEQKHVYYDDFLVPYLKEHSPAKVLPNLVLDRLPKLVKVDLPSPLLVILLPVAALGLSDRRRLVVLSVVPMFFGLYALNAVFLEHYTLVVSPMVAILVVLACHNIVELFPRIRAAVLAITTTAVLVLAAGGFPEINRKMGLNYEMPMVALAQAQLSVLERKPAVVLFEFGEWSIVHDEPVYNVTTAWPDDAEIIRAHYRPDLERIIRYYADPARGGPRHFYRFDPERSSPVYLGRADELLRLIEQSPPTTAPPAGAPASGPSRSSPTVGDDPS